MTIDEAKSLIGKEVTYMNQTSILTDVKLQNTGMILAYTDKNWVLNIDILKFIEETAIPKKEE